MFYGGSAASARRICSDEFRNFWNKVGLRRPGRPLRKFSKGMLQRIGFAQALIHDPELVILDEPMSGLDPVGRKEVRDIILSLRDQGKTVFLALTSSPTSK